MMNTKIMIVDDNEQNISLMKLLLTHAGYTVISANNGAEGLKLARLALPDLILMDIQMPDMNGFDVAHEILTDEHTCTIPVIGISAYASPITRERALRLGMVGFFEKPINRERFVAQVSSFLPQTTVDVADGERA